MEHQYMAQASLEHTKPKNMSCQCKMNRFKEKKLRKSQQLSNIFSGNCDYIRSPTPTKRIKISIHKERKYNEFHYKTLYSFAERSYLLSCLVLARLLLYRLPSPCIVFLRLVSVFPRLHFMSSYTPRMERKKDISRSERESTIEDTDNEKTVKMLHNEPNGNGMQYSVESIQIQIVK